MSFQDHFSRVSDRYARYRPTYPAAVFEWLASVAPRRDLAWDCATGNGQAAVGLSDVFSRVVATDASAGQIASAVPRDTIEYRVAPADRSGLGGHSADVVTCAQALHWLPRDGFYAEARRVLRPDGVIAVWGYHIPIVGEDAIDEHILHYHDVVVGPYWPLARQLVLDCFTTIEFPFAELAVPEFDMRCQWTLEDYAKYLGTQSATDRYRQAHGGHDPVPAFVEAVAPLWGPDRIRDVIFPMFMRAGRV